jgi:riboflavin kinase / FMN adenylyltransferase
MKIYTDIFTKNNIAINGIIAIGYFDSIHLGHQKILSELINQSKKLNKLNYVLTYKNLPKKNKSNRKILELDVKLNLIKEIGIENVILCEYNDNFSSLTPDIFVNLIKSNFNIDHYVIGKDFGFGKNKEGNADTLKNNNFDVTIVDPYCIDSQKVSTSIIKDAIIKGNIEFANNLMGRSFFIEGEVKKCKQIGRTIGFPTMNITNENIILPKDGTYITKTTVKNVEYYSMTFVGNNLIETNLLDYNDFAYNMKIKIDFLKKIRDNKVFSDFALLRKQIFVDLETTKKYFGI